MLRLISNKYSSKCFFRSSVITTNMCSAELNTANICILKVRTWTEKSVFLPQEFINFHISSTLELKFFIKEFWWLGWKKPNTNLRTSPEAISTVARVPALKSCQALLLQKDFLHMVESPVLGRLNRWGSPVYLLLTALSK